MSDVTSSNDNINVVDIGEVSAQRLLDGGLNSFAVELLAESYVRTVLPAMDRGVRFTIEAKNSKGEKIKVRITLEPVEAIGDGRS